MGHEQIFVAIGVEVARINAHASLGDPGAIDRHTRQQRAVSEAAVLLIDPQLVRLAIVRDVDVRPPIGIEVGGHHPERRTVVTGHLRLGGDVDKRPVPTIAIQPVRNGRVALRHAIVPFAGAGEARALFPDGVVDVVGDIQVEPPVPVDVDERRRHAPPGIARACLVGDVGKGPVTVVAEQLVRPEPGTIHVDPAVVIDVTRRHPDAVGAHPETAPLGHVRETQGAGPVGVHLEVVPVQTIRQRPGVGREQGVVERLAGAEHLALDDVDVEVAIVVHVEQRHTGGHELADVELA